MFTSIKPILAGYGVADEDLEKLQNELVGIGKQKRDHRQTKLR